MINIRALVKGEPDIPPFTKSLYFPDGEEQIFFRMIDIVKEKLARGLRLNVHESLLVYAAFLVSEIQTGKVDSQILCNAPKVLARENVLIGVPETLRKLTFAISVDNLPGRTISIDTPIPITTYVMGRSGSTGVTSYETAP